MNRNAREVLPAVLVKKVAFFSSADLPYPDLPSLDCPPPAVLVPPRGLQDNAQNQGPEENARTLRDSGNEETIIPATGNQYVRPYSWPLTSTRSMEILAVPARGTDQTLRLPFQPNNAHTTSSRYSAPQLGSLPIVIEPTKCFFSLRTPIVGFIIRSRGFRSRGRSWG
jgi:hypothetical protein